jgi:hypothetical protein
MDFREPRRWARTTKLLNSNSLMGTNNRFELLFESIVRARCVAIFWVLACISKFWPRRMTWRVVVILGRCSRGGRRD